MSWREHVKDTARLDDACRMLRIVAKQMCVDGVELHVRADGRVAIRTIKGPFTKDIGQADVLPDCGDSLQNPSAELCDMLDGLRQVGRQRV